MFLHILMIPLGASSRLWCLRGYYSNEAVRVGMRSVAAPGDFTFRGFSWSPLRLMPGEANAKEIAGALNELIFKRFLVQHIVS